MILLGLLLMFTLPGDPLLQMRALEVPLEAILSDETRSDVDRMFEAAGGERSDIEKRTLVGLAAPQIGILKRIILVDIGIGSDRREFGQLIVYVNPEIVWASEEIVYGREGCFSIDSHVAGIVPRSERIQIRALDRSGAPVEAEFSGFTARIFQHEMDHLEGIRFPDRVGPEGKLHWVEEDQRAEYRDRWETWECACPWEFWLAMKAGRQL
jgi:peptide deformylase